MTDIPQRSVRSLAQLFNDSNQNDILDEVGSDESDGEVIEDSLQSPLSTSGGFLEAAKHFESKFGAGSSRIFWKRKQSSPTSNSASEETPDSENIKPPAPRSRLHWRIEKPDFLKDPVEEKQNVNEGCELQDVSDDENQLTYSQPKTEFEENKSGDNQVKGLKGFMDTMKSSIRLFTDEDLQQFLKMTEISMSQESNTLDPMNEYYDNKANRNKTQEQVSAEESTEQLSAKEKLVADDKTTQEPSRAVSVNDKTDENVTSSVSKAVTPRTESYAVADETDSQSLGAVTNIAKTFKMEPEETKKETELFVPDDTVREITGKAIDFSQTFIIKHKTKNTQKDKNGLSTTTQSPNDNKPPPQDTRPEAETVSTDIPDNDSKQGSKTMISVRLEKEVSVDISPTCRWNPEKWNYRCAKQKDVQSPVVKWSQHKKLADHKINKILHEVYTLPVNQENHFEELIPTKVRCVALGRKSGRVMVTGKRTDVNIWVVGKSSPVVSLSGHKRPVDFVTFGHGEELVATSETSGAVRLWDIEHSKSASELAGHSKSVTSMDFESTGSYLVSGSLDNTIKLWDIRCNRYGCINSIRPKTNEINSVRFSPDGKWLASAEDGCVKLWDLTAGKRFGRLDDYTGSVTTVEFHPYELLLASGGTDRTIKLWDLETFHVVSSTNCNFEPLRLLFHSNGRHLLCGGRDELRIYDWDKLRTCQLVATSWGEVSDLAICNNELELTAATIAHDKIWCYAVSLEKCQLTHGSPIKKRDSTSLEETKPRLSLLEGENAPNAGYQTRIVHKGDNRTDTDHVYQETAKSSRIPIPDKDVGKPASKDRKPKQCPTPRLSEQLPQPSRNLTITEPSDQELLTFVTDGHLNLTRTISDRSRNLNRIRDVWSQRKEKKNAIVKAMDMAISMQDKEILKSLLQILGCKLSLWSLDLCVLLLPQIEAFLKDHNESFVLCGVDGVKGILEKYGSLIKENVDSPPGKTVDVSREERYNKCCECYKTLTSIKEIVSGKQKGHLHRHYNQLYSMLCVVIPD